MGGPAYLKAPDALFLYLRSLHLEVSTHDPNEGRSDRVLVPLPVLRRHIRVHSVREEHPLHELIGRGRAFARYEHRHVSGVPSPLTEPQYPHLMQTRCMSWSNGALPGSCGSRPAASSSSSLRRRGAGKGKKDA